jgi:hypothetical protein
MNMQQTSDQFAPWLLTEKQKKHHLFVCHQVPGEIRNIQNLPSGAITGDET